MRSAAVLAALLAMAAPVHAGRFEAIAYECKTNGPSHGVACVTTGGGSRMAITTTRDDPAAKQFFRVTMINFQALGGGRVYHRHLSGGKWRERYCIPMGGEYDCDAWTEPRDSAPIEVWNKITPKK